ncbi:Crp/Fnr family transcriptional regulator [Dethiobacter alkaliphilus]|uniref:Transcriptional regulator, Crp/Fnr family n=1 Tax=Dethiobacter alkaliphilus AHT 1 TaxID=555088 RepID=C0GFA6_DETAL|nr:Crp/Fnr family transcriptional regulator [Dethiobacter alkaliphilus]EEG77866.1 transcriptional regulator, Crp/Fnr family [Dethiobacter alkaliphilus AHT 1]MCW3488617.1 Crp/Fnr family transcriptional regulator [Dethiobacter alkaliphilus]
MAALNKNVEYLKKVPFFEGLSEEDLGMVAAVMIERSYAKGSVLFMEGEQGEALFVIRQGRVKISKSTADGREQILHMLKDGDIFAEVVLFDRGPYPATAEAVEDTQCWLLRSADMEKLMQSHPLLAIKLLRVMSKRLRQAQLLVRDLALHDAYGRMAGLLLRFARREGKQTKDGIVLELDLTRQEMASMIGTSRETVARILSRFQKDGVLTLDKQRIVLLDEEKLREWT